METLGKLEPAALAQHAAAVAARLEDCDPYFDDRPDRGDDGVRWAAVKTLGKLEPPVLALHAALIVAKLEDPDRCVRIAAVQTLDKLEAAALAPHRRRIRAAVRNILTNPEYGLWSNKNEDSDPVRRAAKSTLDKLRATAHRAE